MKPKATYYSETDTLAIEITTDSAVESDEVATTVFIEFGGNREVVGIVIEHASETLQTFTAAKLAGQPGRKRIA
jgi:uncharacterized protein YuzE